MGKGATKDELIRAAMLGDVEGVVAALAAGAPVNAFDASGQTALHYACFHAREPVVRTLLDAGADPDLPNKKAGPGRVKGLTALGAVCSSFFAAEGRAEVIAALLAKGANPNVPDGDGRTPLFHLLLERGAADAVKALLDGGADPKHVDKEGNGVLALAKGPIAALLAKAGAPGDVAPGRGAKKSPKKKA